MSDFLTAIKADLMSIWLRPVVLLAVVAAVAAVIYASGAGGKAPTLPPAPPSASVPTVPGPSVGAAPPNPHSAIAETTSGSGFQHGGVVHNPFAPQPSGESSKSGAESSGKSGGATSTGKGSNGSASQGGGTSSEESSTGKTITIYRVSATLQRVNAAGDPVGAPRKMDPAEYLTELPGKQSPLFTLYGTATAGKGAVFLLLRAPILHGGAGCLPSPEDCLAISVPLHKSEQLQYLGAKDQTISYVLTVTKMTQEKVPVALIEALKEKATAIVKERIEKLSKVLPG